MLGADPEPQQGNKILLGLAGSTAVGALFSGWSWRPRCSKQGVVLLAGLTQSSGNKSSWLLFHPSPGLAGIEAKALAGRLSPARWQWGLAEAVKWWCGPAESSVVVGALCSWFGHFPLGCTEMCEAARPEILEKHLPCSDFDLFSSCTRCPALSSAGVLQIPRSALGSSASQSPAVLAAPGQPTSATSNLFFSFPSLAFLC